MNDFFSTLIRFVFRAVLLAMGLIFAFSLLCAGALLALLWGLRRMWARLTGRPVQAWVFRVDPRAGWNRFYRANPWGTRQGGAQADPQAEAARQQEQRLQAMSGDWRERRPQDVTDVDPK